MGDFKVQRGVTTVSADGETATLGASVSSTSSAFVILTSSRHTGSSVSTGNAEGDDMSVGAYLSDTSTITFVRPTTTPGIDIDAYWEVWEYTGSGGGANEFIVRHQSVEDMTSVASKNVTLSGISSADDCVPFITGCSTADTTDGANNLTNTARLTSSTNLELRVGVNSATQKRVVVTVVEFTGSAWSVGHGWSSGTTADSGTITLNTAASGSGGSTFDVSDWGTAAIVSWGHSGDSTNQAIADNWPNFVPGSGTTTVDWTFNANHDGSSDDLAVHVLKHADLAVTRFSSTSNTAGDTNIDITSAGLTDLSQSSILGTATSSGTGTAYDRGWRSFTLTSLTNAVHHAGRSGNTLDVQMQVIDWTGVAGATTHNGDASVTVAPATAGSGGTTKPGSAGDVSVAPATTATGTVTRYGSADLGLDASTAGSGVVTDIGTFTLGVEPTTTASGDRTQTGSVSIVLDAATSASGDVEIGSVTHYGDSSLDLDATTAASSSTSKPGSSALGLDAATGASGLVSDQGVASLSVSVASDASGTVTKIHSGDASVSVGVSTGSSSVVARYGSVALGVDAVADGSANLTMLVGGSVTVSVSTSASGDAAQTLYIFRPPTVQQGHGTWSTNHGVTVIVESGVYRETRFPHSRELRNADNYWLGGHNHVIDSDTKDALTAAGYGDNITLKDV